MSKTLQFKITLAGSKPPIWRRFRIADSYRLDRFHQAIQITMGWYNAHLHEFVIHNERYGMHLPGMGDGFDEGKDEAKFFLKDFQLKKGDKIRYLYDFGDSWEHLLAVEEVSEDTIKVPVCLKGKGACPPEDSGGIWGYSDMIEIIKDPKHPEHEDFMEWLPEGFNPSLFDMEATNAALKDFGDWHNKNPKAKSTPWHQI